MLNVSVESDLRDSCNHHIVPENFLGFTVDLSAPGTTSRMIQMYFHYTYDYPVYVDWGDGTFGAYTDAYGSSSPSHTYAVGQDVFDIRVWSDSGELPGFFVPSDMDANTVKALVDVWNCTFTCANLDKSSFNDCSNLRSVDLRLFRNNVYTAREWFRHCPSLRLTVPKNLFQHVSPRDYVEAYNAAWSSFYQTNRLENYITGEFPDIPEGTVSIANVFYNCGYLTGNLPSIPSSVRLMSHAFHSCLAATGSLPQIPSGVTVLDCAFMDCWNVTGGFVDLPSGVTNINSVFRVCRKLSGQIPAFPPNVTTAQYSYQGCPTSGNIPTFPNTLQNIKGIFYGCSYLKGPIPNFPTSLVTGHTAFYNCYSLEGTIPAFPSGLTDMTQMFYNCTSLSGSIPAFPSGVSSLDCTFTNCFGLTGPIPTIPSSVTVVQSAFSGCGLLTGQAPPLWDKSQYPNIPTPSSRNYCFYNCVSLSNYDSIPALWK